MKIKTSELTGTTLDWAVAKCEGAAEKWRSGAPFLWDGTPCIRMYGHDVDYTPSADPAQGHPIIEREGIATRPRLLVGTSESGQDVCERHGWIASMGYNPQICRYRHEAEGPTALIAAMRAFVASKLGDEVDVPEELTCSPTPKNG